MRFCVDQNLPEVLADWLTANCHEAEHVKRLGLAEAPDPIIRAYAARQGAVLISKDADFAALGGARPFIWVRIGNTTNRRMIEIWSRAWPSILSALEQGDTLVEVWP
jgi:predicted nuclease of predicted toxin-antitoxin system